MTSIFGDAEESELGSVVTARPTGASSTATAQDLADVGVVVHLTARALVGREKLPHVGGIDPQTDEDNVNEVIWLETCVEPDQRGV